MSKRNQVINDVHFNMQPEGCFGCLLSIPMAILILAGFIWLVKMAWAALIWAIHI